MAPARILRAAGNSGCHRLSRGRERARRSHSTQPSMKSLNIKVKRVTEVERISVGTPQTKNASRRAGAFSSWRTSSLFDPSPPAITAKYVEPTIAPRYPRGWSGCGTGVQRAASPYAKLLMIGVARVFTHSARFPHWPRWPRNSPCEVKIVPPALAWRAGVLRLRGVHAQNALDRLAVDHVPVLNLGREDLGAGAAIGPRDAHIRDHLAVLLAKAQDLAHADVGVQLASLNCDVVADLDDERVRP
eukprot:CAMPEP_0179870730 /NCGR_PEP_ID=MMETSP0982-20121206/20420_1 /TAXON_ID=483367 /ORGANISM="non described non described, Strain CCMP 2436" /LENGTH=244 /DNA_ID=CAMNT_0021761297 /DNA_START=100 /DNA_END=831 /DNA_ORIENTATION=-